MTLEKMSAVKTCSQANLLNVALEAIRDVGFFKATAEPSDGFAVTILPGAQYRFAGFTLRGNYVLTEQELQHVYALQPGELASRASLGRTLENVRMAYARVGLRKAVVTPILISDEQEKILKVDLQVDEGS